MTQEQLAEIMNVSRPMISHWENGRTQPDIECLKRLSQALQYDFFQSEEASDVETHMPPLPQWKWRWGYICAFLCGVLATLFVQFVLFPPANVNQKGEPSKPLAKGVDSEYTIEVKSIEWFMQQSEPVEGQAQVIIRANENPVKAVRTGEFDSGVGWLYTVYLNERNGIAFTVEEYSLAFFLTENRVDLKQYKSDDIKSWWGDNSIPARGQRIATGGMPLQQMLGIGVMITGVDENGNQLEFHEYIALSQEIAR